VIITRTMALFFYRFKTFGLIPSYSLKFENLYFHTIENHQDDCVIETIRSVRSITNTKKEIMGLLELLGIFYLKEINYYQIEQKKDKNTNWKRIEQRSAVIALTDKPHPFYEERDINEFLKLVYMKKRYEERIRIANALLIAARVKTLVFEAQFILRWVALERLVNDEIPKSILTERQFSWIKKEWQEFTKKDQFKKFKTTIAFVEDKINDAKLSMTFMEKFKKFIKKRKLPINYNDIKEIKKVRDRIVHTGSFQGLEYNFRDCHNFSMQLQSLIRNILMHYLGLEFDPEWQKWYSRRYWRPQKRK
jgi:hypothetical protein